MNRTRRIVRAIVLASAVVGAGAPAGPAAGQGQPEGQVVVYSAADADMVNAMVAAFQQRYPAVKASTVVAGTGELIKRVEAEAARPLGDLLWSVGPESLAAKKNLLAPYESREAAAFYPGQAPADHSWTPFTVMPYIIMYNKKLVSEAEAPRTWKDVLDPRWKGKVAYADATKSGSSYTLLVTWLTIFGKNDAGWRFVEDLLRQAKVLPKSSMTYQMVANGEVPIGLTFEQAAFDYLKGGAPIGIVYPAEGTAVIPDGSALIANAPHPGAARLFLDFTVSKDAQALMVEKFGRRSVRRDVATPAGLPALDKIKAIAYDLREAADGRTQILKRFQDTLVRTQ
ncbi:MAG TPA: extracellular solute-binding protein [Methylomirabilota bacterium]|jgi:iron(III) transport system substrate-binding protein|nr:extracellular solute-binding protein [Methylomirabilota bacterium]